MSSLLETRLGFPLINEKFKSLFKQNGVRPFNKCGMWMSSLPATSRIGFHPLIIGDVKSTRNIDKLTTDRIQDVLLSRITGQSESLF